MYIGFSSNVMKPPEITDYINRVVRPQLQTIFGVAEAEILTNTQFAMRIWLNPDRMAARMMSISPYNEITLSLHPGRLKVF